MTSSSRSSFTPLENLINPTTDSPPVGEWLRYEHIYDQIREARRFDDPDLSQGIWQRELKKPDWETVESLCNQTLIHHSKDLQIAAWLSEAWIAFDGFEGLTRGIELLRTLCEKFWPALYPPIEEEDMEYRLRILEWLDDTFTQRILRIPLTGSDIKEHGYTLADWMSANQLETVVKRSTDGQKLIQAAEEKNEPTLAKFSQALQLTDAGQIQNLQEGVNKALQELTLFKKTIDQLAHNQSPSYKTIFDRLNDAKRLFQAPSPPPHASESPSSPYIPVIEPREAEIPVDGLLTNRRSAYQQLQQIALYLDSIEPHSPTPHLLKRIVTWQDKTLTQIFAEFGESPQELTFLAKLMEKTQ